MPRTSVGCWTTWTSSATSWSRRSRPEAISPGRRLAPGFVESEDQGGVSRVPVAFELGPVPDPACALDQVAAKGQLLRLPFPQRCLDIAAGPLQRLGQRPGVGGRLGRPRRGVWPRGEGGVTHQAGASEDHGRDLEIEYHLEGGLLGSRDHLGYGGRHPSGRVRTNLLDVPLLDGAGR